MVDPKDNATLPPIDPPKRRGRPPTGRAMSAAERKRRSRENARAKQVAELTDTQLCEALACELATLKRQTAAGRANNADTTKWHLGCLLAELQTRVNLA